MPDRDDLGGAWRVPPSQYLARRPATHRIPEPRACYVKLRDGVKLAVDYYIPERHPGEGRDPIELGPGLRRGDDKFPTIVILTPYYRRFAVSAPGAEPSPNVALYRDFFIPRGYAMVAVDVRGTGASFGTRDSFRSPREREDHREVADWIVKQPWSNGVIGSTGISYLGAAACFLASTGHPAVKAIAPLFAVHDTYADHVFPGGLKCLTVTETYDDLVQALDQDLRERLAPYPYFADKRYAGPAPVDEDGDGRLRAAAIDQHRDSFKLRDLAPELAFREEAAPHDPGLHSGACSPYWYMLEAKGKVATYSVSGWYDGSAFPNGSVARFLTMAGPDDRLLLGPWDHGARTNGSPWRDRPAPEFPLMAEVLRFFDQHLMGLDAGLADEAPIHYLTLHEERWKSATSWPPVPVTTRYHLHVDGKLDPGAPARAAKVDYAVRFVTGTGRSSRYERLGAFAVIDYYADWRERQAAMASFTTEPFDAPVELTGHAVVSLRVSTSERDGSVFVYLSEVEADGNVRYVAEGGLRMLHRALATPPATYKASWPYHTFRRADAKLMQPGVAEEMRFALVPVSWRFAQGSRLRVSVAGADGEHFAQVPHGRPPWFEIVVGGADGSFVELPLRR
jgi:putative CocE/NonD family hydrolase